MKLSFSFLFCIITLSLLYSFFAGTVPADESVPVKPKVTSFEELQKLLNKGKTPSSETGGSKNTGPTSKFRPMTVFEKTALSLYKKGRLFEKESYQELRQACCQTVMDKLADKINQEWGAPTDEFRSFMSSHAELQELYFTSLRADQETDAVSPSLRLMKLIWEHNSSQMEKFPGLAIAVALVWDRPEDSLTWSPIRQHRAKDLPEEEKLHALENFSDYANASKILGKRIEYMPWEYLALLIDHTTSAAERDWARKNYLSQRVGIGKTFFDIKYDTGVFTPGNGQLTDQLYTLPNVLKYGAICTGQADFSVRVAKSIGVPAFRIFRGEDKSGGFHSWAMWIEVTDSANGKGSYSIKTVGRFFNRNYYFGEAVDPAESRKTTDRRYAMKLFSIGRDEIAYRQSELLLRAYDLLAPGEKWSPVERWDYLNKITELNPFCEGAWRKMAEMVYEKELKVSSATAIRKALTRLFVVFENHPDFTWDVFDDFVSFETKLKKKSQYYSKLCDFYEKAKRPDLSGKARLKYAFHLNQEKRYRESLQCLASACLTWPDEGTIVTPLLDEMDHEIGLDSENKDKNRQSQAVFYRLLLSKIKVNEKDPGSYLIRTSKRAIKVFRETGNDALADQYQKKLNEWEANK